MTSSSQDVATEPPWFDEAAGYFDADYLRLFEDPGFDPDFTALQADFAARRLELRSGARVLDVACGAGRLARALARREFEVTGTDLNAGFLKTARSHGQASGPRFVRADMRDAVFASGTFDAVVSTGNSFGFFQDDVDDDRILDAIRLVLKPGGRLLLDLWNTYGSIRHFPAETVSEPVPGVRVVQRNRVDPVRGVSIQEIERHDEHGRIHRSTVWTRLYTVPELQTMLERAGFELTGCFGDYEGAELTVDSMHSILLARAER